MKNLIILLKSLMINSQAEQPRETENPVKKSIKIKKRSLFKLIKKKKKRLRMFYNSPENQELAKIK